MKDQTIKPIILASTPRRSYGGASVYVIVFNDRIVGIRDTAWDAEMLFNDMCRNIDECEDRGYVERIRINDLNPHNWDAHYFKNNLKRTFPDERDMNIYCQFDRTEKVKRSYKIKKWIKEFLHNHSEKVATTILMAWVSMIIVLIICEKIIS